MALDNRLVVYNEQGEPVDYDILASDVKFLPDGKDLPTKLAELEDEIGQGGYAPPAGGIPKTDLAQSVQDSLDKADSALQDEDVAEVAKTGDYNDLENKPTIPDTSNLATKTELATKQDKISAGNGITIGNDGKTVSVAETIRTGAGKGATAVQSVTINGGNPVTPDGNGNVDLTGLQMPVISISDTTGNWTIDGQDTGFHAQGETGNITATDGVVTFGLINNLSSLDTDKGLTAKMGHDLLLLIAQIYDSLGASAFWGNKPAIDWSRIGLTYKSITRTLDANCSSSKSDSRVLYGSSYQEVISTASGYVLNSITLTMVGDANAQSYVDLATGVINIPEVTGDITIVAASTAGYTVTKNLTGASSSNTAVGLLPNAAFESMIDAVNAWQMVDHDFTCVMGSTELPIVLEDGYPANAVPSASNHVDIENDDCVVWKCDYDSVNKKYSKPYFQVSIKAVTGDITITGKAVNVLQDYSLGGKEDQSANYAESGSVANRTGWVHSKRFPMPANINGARDNDTLDWRFSSGSSEVSGNHSGCTIRMSTHLYSLTNDETISGGDHFDVVVYYGIRGNTDTSSGKRNVARKTASSGAIHRMVTASYHFTSEGSLSGKGIKEGADSIIDAADFLPPTE